MMPGLIEDLSVVSDQPVALPTFQISKQRVELDIDPVARKIEGETTIEFTPLDADLRAITLHCRQARILRVKWDRALLPCSFDYNDPYDAMITELSTTAQQHQQLKRKLPKDPEARNLEIRKPKSCLVKEKPQVVTAASDGKKSRAPVVTYETMKVTIKFVVEDARDALHFVGWDLEDVRYPHIFTQTTGKAAIASLFPCIDTINDKYQWELSITTPRTIGDAFLRHAKDENSIAAQKLQTMSETDKSLDLITVCSGVMTDDRRNDELGTRTCTFAFENLVLARHIGFAIGPFEEVNLAEFRESDEDDRLGKNAVHIHAFCLPGRSAEVKNTCFPIARAMDYFATDYTQYPFNGFKMCFVDDLLVDHHDTASLSICSNNMLFGEDIIDTLYETTRKLVFALATQWSGINLTAAEPSDFWLVIGIAYFMTDCFLKTIFGNNEYRYRQKVAAGMIVEQDIGVPSLLTCGSLHTLDRFHYDFMALKAPVVLFILDRRLHKLNASYSLTRMIGKAMRDNSDGTLSTNSFFTTCARSGHTNLDTFRDQWVAGCGCPNFTVVQRFNKKKLVVEMQIEQVQSKRDSDVNIEASTFAREVKEHTQNIYAEVHHCFVGPMTIRIHEADGTPYEHIVEIKETKTRFEIPYNTKYKRLKRSRRQREKINMGTGDDANGEGADDVLLYCLGDNLQSDEDYREWRLENFSQDDIERMGQESYEWIRMDADFEWICALSINMPGYMFVSQLQQDRDVVAQVETVNYMAAHKPNPLICTFLIRTLMDERYFYGVRTAAANALRAHSKGPRGGVGFYQLQKAFQEFFCLPGSLMTSPNDFSNRAAYQVQLAIVKAISGIRADDKRAPYGVRRFLYEVLHYNDNGENEYSDSFYISALLRGLAEAVASAPLDEQLSIENGDDYEFLTSCWNEIERYQRRDGWVPSYHNIISVSALYAKFCLDKAGCVSRNRAEFLFLSQPGNHEDLRIAALKYLFALRYGFSDTFLTYFFSAYISESSLRTRARMMLLLNNFVGAVAIGDYKEPAATTTDVADGLVIEQDDMAAARQAEIARKRTVDGALQGLKEDLGPRIAFKVGIWGAVLSDRTTLEEFSELLDLCSWLYEAQTSVMVTIKLPREVRYDSHRVIKHPGQKPKVMLILDLDGPVRTAKRVKYNPRSKSLTPAAVPSLPPQPVAVPPTKIHSEATPTVSSASTKLTIKLSRITKPTPQPSTNGTQPLATTVSPRPPTISIPSQSQTASAAAAAGSPSVAVTPGIGGAPRIRLKFGNKPKTNGVNGANGANGADENGTGGV